MLVSGGTYQAPLFWTVGTKGLQPFIYMHALRESGMLITQTPGQVPVVMNPQNFCTQSIPIAYEK